MQDIFQNITSNYKSYPYKECIYCLWDDNENGYIYTILDDNSLLSAKYGLKGNLLPLFYEQDFANLFTSLQKNMSVKILSRSGLKTLSIWCESENVIPVFLTTIDRRNSGEYDLHKTQKEFKYEFTHLLFSKIN